MASSSLAFSNVPSSLFAWASSISASWILAIAGEFTSLSD